MKTAKGKINDLSYHLKSFQDARFAPEHNMKLIKYHLDEIKRIQAGKKLHQL